jgi:large subunit ribosomal protein L17
MRHRVAHRKLGRTTPHRIALLRNLTAALFERERIRTTLPKAKEVRPFAERLITLARREDDRLHARRLAARDIHDRQVVKKLFDSIGPRFATRPGGYTRIMRLGPRQGDGAEMAILELVGYEFKSDAKGKDEKGKKAEKKEAAPKADEKKKPAKKKSAPKKKAAAKKTD